MPLLDLVLYSVLFLGVTSGLGLPIVSRLALDPAEKYLAGLLVGIAVVYAAAWTVYLAGLSAGWLRGLPLLALVGVLSSHRELTELLLDAAVRPLLQAHLLFTTWTIGLLTLISSYGGGEWSADWFEHHHRALFFLERQPLDTLFLGVYTLPARPPLANLVDSAYMAMTSSGFAEFQLFNALASTLVVVPTVLLARRLAGKGTRSDPVVVAVLMLSPFVVQNVTFAWTKMLAAFFVLGGVVLYLEGLARDSATRRHLAVAAFALGTLAHFSAAPYAVAMAICHITLLVRRGSPSVLPGEIAVQAGIALVLLLPWFGWALANYGASGTFLSNTTATANSGAGIAGWLGVWAWNTFVTFVPHFLRPADYVFIAQTEAVGFLRDYTFTVYQTTVPGFIGLAGLVVTFFTLRRLPAAIFRDAGSRIFWTSLVLCALLLGILTATWRDRWGVAHICLLPLGLATLAWIAARIPDLPPAARRAWGVALTIDAALGIALHHFLQATATLRPTMHLELASGAIVEYGRTTVQGLILKFVTSSRFVADDGPSAFLVVPALAAGLAWAVWQCRRSLAAQGS